MKFKEIKNLRFKRHFRFCIYNNHPAYILKESNNSYIYLSLTHAPYYHHTKNILLKGAKNDNRKMYIVPVVFVADKHMFSKNKMRLKFDYADGTIIRDINKFIKRMK